MRSGVSFWAASLVGSPSWSQFSSGWFWHLQPSARCIARVGWSSAKGSCECSAEEAAPKVIGAARARHSASCQSASRKGAIKASIWSGSVFLSLNPLVLVFIVCCE